jgi:diguanylate cyclase
MVSTKNKIFIALSLFILCSDLLFVFINYRNSHNALQESFNQIGEQITSAFSFALDSTETRMLQIATFIANDQRVQELFLEGKLAVKVEGGGAGGINASIAREKLLEIVGPSYEKLSAKFDFRQIHFHIAPGSLSFLRAHMPNKFGDRMDQVRNTVVIANRDLIPTSGFETGRVYSGIRGVVPVFATDYQKKELVHIGAVEAGTAFSTMIENIAKKQKTNISVLLTVKHLKENVWPVFLDKLFKENPPINDYMIEATTDPMITSILANHGKYLSNSTYIDLFKKDEKFYHLINFPLSDFKGKRDRTQPAVGIVLAWHDVTKEVVAFNYSLWINILYAVIGFVFIEILLFVSIQSVCRRLEKKIGEGKASLTIMNEKLTTDLAERQKFENELQINQLRLSEAQEIAHIGNWEWNIASGCLWWSDQIYHIFGLEPQEFKASYENFLQTVHPDDFAYVKKSVEEALEQRKSYNIEHRIILPDGTIRFVHERAKVYFLEDGQPQRMVGTVQDITDKKLVEDALKDVQNNLEQKILERTEQLEQANTALKILLQHSSEAKKELETKVVLNIKELINPYLETLESNYNTDSNLNNMIYIDLIKSNIHNITSEFSKNLNEQFTSLTPREIQIADFIKHGKSTKQIADTLNISISAVEFHRNNLRTKLGIKKQKTNLRSFLISLS